ncbi:MAG: PGPGW domain-containing protein [Actinomycetota bacterium]
MLVNMASDKTQNIDVRDLTRELPRVVVRRRARRVLVSVAGGALLVTGFAFTVVPAVPGFPFFVLGLAVMATEYHWARRMQATLKARLKRARRRLGRPR